MTSRARWPALLAVALAVCALGTPRALDRAPQSLDGPRPIATIPFEFSGNHAWLSARVNGSRPLHYQFDSAASGCSLNRSIVDDLQLPIVREFDERNVGTGNGATRMAILGAGVLDLGGVTLAFDRLFAVPYDDVACDFGEPIDGIVGLALLERYAVRVDYDARTIALFDPVAFAAAPHAGIVVPLDVDRHGMPLVRARLALPGVASLDGRFLVDSAYAGAVLCTTPFEQQHGVVQRLRGVGRRLEYHNIGGIGGRNGSVMVRALSLQIGDYVLKEPIASFAVDASGGSMARGDIAGIVGTEILRRFLVTFDRAGRRLILERSRQFADPFESDSAGMTIHTRPRAYRDFEVGMVMPGAPAAIAGISVRDRILHVNGQPAASWSLSDLKQLFRRPGVEHELVLLRGERRVTVRLRTRPLM